MDPVPQLPVNQIYQASSRHVSEQSSQTTTEEVKQQRENLRKQTFFTPVQLIANNANHNGNMNNLPSEYRSFFDTLRTANFLQVKDFFIKEVENFKKVTKYFAENKYATNLENFISRIRGEQEPEKKSPLLNHIRFCVLSLHNLTSVLNNLKYQLEPKETATKNIFSKDAITVYLDGCMEELGKCWAGVNARFINGYDTLSSLNEGVLGKINIIKKELLDTILTEYLTAKRQEGRYLFLAGNEIHMRNALNNALQEILGIHKIVDPLENGSLNEFIKQEFIELATIEISPARITSMLADSFYQELTTILDEASMSSWLTEYKSYDQLLPDFLDKLTTKFFDKMNILFDASEENKLNLYTLLDVLETKTESTKYCLHQSRAKLHQWIAKCLMPDTETVFKEISNGLTIKSTDYMFFEVSKTADNNNHSDSADYIPLQLSHLDDIDFINFTDVELNNNCYLSDHKNKTTTSITLVTQAMEQTDDPAEVVKFIINNPSIINISMYFNISFL